MRVKLKVKRMTYEKKSYWQEYELEMAGWKPRVLEVLQKVYLEQDSGLAFSYGCRYKRCGMCGMIINGKPRLACITEATEFLTLEPLHNLPVIRDLVIDRGFIWGTLLANKLYVDVTLGYNVEDFETIKIPESYHLLSKCVECLCCVAMCPCYKGDKQFGGPFLFVKLAQTYSNPKDHLDRLLQAEKLGINRCRYCGKCSCPNGVPIYKVAITSLLPQDSIGV